MSHTDATTILAADIAKATGCDPKVASYAASAFSAYCGELSCGLVGSGPGDRRGSGTALTALEQWAEARGWRWSDGDARMRVINEAKAQAAPQVRAA